MVANLLVLGLALFSTNVVAIAQENFPPGCNADNCLRAIAGTRAPNTRQPRPNLSGRLADCTSFQQITVTPAPSTTTVDNTGGIAKRQAQNTGEDGRVTERPTAVPAYASCGPSGNVAVRSSRYSSGCSCAGVPQTTSEAATPTVTETCPAAQPTACDEDGIVTCRETCDNCGEGQDFCNGECKGLGGLNCGGDDDCVSGNCDEGFCTFGECPVQQECGEGQAFCNGSCRGRVGLNCQLDGQCVSNNCSEGFCTDGECIETPDKFRFRLKY